MLCRNCCNWSCTLHNTFSAKALNPIVWLPTDEQALKFYSVATSVPATEVLFLPGATSCLTREFKEWTQCASLYAWNMRKVVWFDHCLLLTAWAVVLQGASRVSGRAFQLETKERRLGFFLFSDVKKKNKNGFLPLLFCFCLFVFFIPAESIKPANQLGNADSNRPWIIKGILSTRSSDGR